MADVGPYSKTLSSASARLRPRGVGQPETGRTYPSGSIDADLKERSAKRLGLVAGFIAAFVAVEGLLSHLWEASEVDSYPTLAQRWDLIGVVLMVATSAAAFAFLRSDRFTTRTRLRIGVAYLICLAYLLSVTDHADHFWQGGHNLHGVPGLVLPMLIFPVIVPMRWQSAFAVALAMACTGPLALFTLQAILDYDPPHSGALVASFPFLGAFVAAFLARIVHQLGVELRQARRLGSYTLIEKLGGGGMGEVWRAQHQLLARPAAIKLIRPDVQEKNNTNAIDRFEREAQTTADLKSPHTIGVYDFGVADDGRLYYVMELVDGIDLDELVKQHGPQSPARVRHWLTQVCHSLDEAHKRGLVHRDIKPANIMTCRYGEDVDFVKVLDFGLVTLGRAIETDDARLTAHGRVVGTPAFMSPELALSGDVDARSDIYAVGCVAFWLLTGKHVFTGRSPMEVVVRHVEREPSPPSAEADQEIPPALDALILSCLAKEPEDRPESAAALRQALSGCVPGPPWTQQDARAWWDTEHRPVAREPSTA